MSRGIVTRRDMTELEVEYIRAMAGVRFPVAHSGKGFVRRMIGWVNAHEDDPLYRKISEGEAGYLMRIAYTFRRQLSARLKPERPK